MTRKSIGAAIESESGFAAFSLAYGGTLTSFLPLLLPMNLPSALSSSSAGGRTSLLYSDLSEIASSGSNEAREAVEGDYLLQTIKRDKDPGGLYSFSGNHESNSSIALPSTNLSPLPNIQPALLSNLERSFSLSLGNSYQRRKMMHQWVLNRMK